MHHDDRSPTRVAGQAVANIPGAPLSRLARPGGIGDERTTQSDQRCLAAGENTVGLSGISDAAKRHKRHTVQPITQGLDEPHVRHGRAVPIRRVHLQRSPVRAACETDVVDISRAGQKIADDAGLGRTNAARHPVIARQLQSDDEILAAGCAQRHDQFANHTHTSSPIATKLVIAPVGLRGQELVKQMAVAGGDFHAEKAVILEMQRGLSDLITRSRISAVVRACGTVQDRSSGNPEAPIASGLRPGK